jgi:flagellar hook-associated protein 2
MPLGAVSFGSGFGSGLDFRAIVDAILNAERQPIRKIQARIDTFSKAKNSYSEVGKLLDELSSKLSQIKTGATFGGKSASLSNADAPLSVQAGASASAGTYEINVTQIAQAQRNKSVTFSDKDSPLVNDGTLTITSGNNDPITIEVSAATGNNSLQAIADSINQADQGVSASIINDGSGAILIVRSKATGTANGLTISDTTNLDLDAAGSVLQAAQNATLTVDGIAISSQSNTVSNAITGVSLTLAGETDGVVNLVVSEDVDGSKDALKGFVESYNKINDFFQKNFGSAAEQRASAIAGSSSARNLLRQVQSLATGSVTGIADGNLNTLAELGITVADRTGRLEFDAERFESLVEQGRFDEVRAVLLSAGSTSDSAVRFQGAAAGTKPGTYAIQVTTAGERAEVSGSTSIAGTGLSAAETLTISLGGDSLDVALAAGDTLGVVISKINTALDNAGIGVTAFSNGGALALRSDEYGALQTIEVVSNVDDAADGNSTGIGTTERTDSGVDIVGTIGGVAAEGIGNELLGADGSDADGLRVKIYATAASVAAKSGNFGTVGYSQGAADRFIEAIDDITDPLEGTIKSLTESFQNSIDDAKERIEAIETRLTAREELLIRQFSAAEQAISRLQQFQAQLSASRR